MNGYDKWLEEPYHQQAEAIQAEEEAGIGADEPKVDLSFPTKEYSGFCRRRPTAFCLRPEFFINSYKQLECVNCGEVKNEHYNPPPELLCVPIAEAIKEIAKRQHTEIVRMKRQQLFETLLAGLIVAAIATGIVLSHVLK